MFPPSHARENAAPGWKRNVGSRMSASRVRANARSSISATNRRMHGMWNTNIPSRFLDELPEAHVEVWKVRAASAAIAAIRRVTL